MKTTKDTLGLRRKSVPKVPEDLKGK